MASLLKVALGNVPECFMSAIQRVIDEMQRRGYASEDDPGVQRKSASPGNVFWLLSCAVVVGAAPRVSSSISPGEQDISWSYYNSTVTALRFLYLQVLERDWSYRAFALCSSASSACPLS